MKKTLLNLAKTFSPNQLTSIENQLKDLFIKLNPKTVDLANRGNVYRQALSEIFFNLENVSFQKIVANRKEYKIASQATETTIHQSESFQQETVVDRNGKGMIKTYQYFRNHYSQDGIFSKQGIAHLLTENAIDGLSPIEEISEKDPQHSLRKYLASEPSAIFIPKDAISEVPKKRF